MSIKSMLETQITHTAFLIAEYMADNQEDKIGYKLEVYIDLLTKYVILNLQGYYAGNHSRVAKSLGVSRTTLLTKMKQYNIFKRRSYESHDE